MSNNKLIDKIKKWVDKNSREVQVDIGFDILDLDAIDANELIIHLNTLKIIKHV